MSAARDVLETSRAVLAGHSGVVAVLKVFLDESGIHDGSPVVTVAAYVARPKEWAAFTRGWKAAIRPVKVYHAADAANCHGEFEGWTKERVAAVAARALPIIPKNVGMGIAIGIQIEHFEEALAGREELRRMLGNPYGACLHWVMATILDEKAKSGNGERIAFFHETNDFKREAWDTFEHMERQYNPLGCRMSFAFGRKDEFVPLQAADVLAYEANKRIRSSKNRNRRALDALHPESGYLDLRLYDRENLPFLIARMEAARLQEEAG